MRKHLLAGLLAVTVLVGVSACGTNGPSGPGGDTGPATNQPIGQKMETPSDEPTEPESTPEDTPADSPTSTDSTDVVFSTYEELMAKLPEYYITLKFSSADGTSSTGSELYIKDQVLITSMDDSSTSVTYVDYKNNHTYMLDTTDKTGEDWGAAGTSATGGMLMSLLVNYGMVQAMLLGEDMFKPTNEGTETIAGVATTKYSYTYGGATVTFWLDNEYGLGLKMDGGTTNWETLRFVTSGVNPADLIDIKEYTIG